jgi:hypothetical protein
MAEISMTWQIWRALIILYQRVSLAQYMVKMTDKTDAVLVARILAAGVEFAVFKQVSECLRWAVIMQHFQVF